jgi:hypothetical protein
MNKQQYVNFHYQSTAGAYFYYKSWLTISHSFNGNQFYDVNDLFFAAGPIDTDKAHLLSEAVETGFFAI